jgi:hypothetical protein
MLVITPALKGTTWQIATGFGRNVCLESKVHSQVAGGSYDLDHDV